MKKLLTTTALILALAGTQALAEGDKGEDSFKGPRRHMEEALSQLPEEKEKLAHETLRKAREDNKVTREQIKTLREESKAILTAQEFDRKAFLAKSDEIHALHNSMRKNMNNAVADLAEQFTVEERKILAEAVPGKPKRGHHRAKDKPEEEGGE